MLLNLKLLFPYAILVFELELFKPKIGILVFSSETRITKPITPKISTKKDSYVPHLSSKFKVFAFSRFKVIAFLASCSRIRNFARKNRDFRRKASRKSQQKSWLLPAILQQIFTVSK